MGKTIKVYHYLPVLDDRNMNDQGIDAAGALGANAAKKVAYIKAVPPSADGTPGAGIPMYFRGDSTVPSTALTIAQNKVIAYLLSQGFNTAADSWAEMTGTPSGAAYVAGYRFTEYPATGNTNYGNFYGSSKDVGTILSKMPALSEQGGAVNRVSVRRIHLEGTIQKYGFYHEWTQESLDFDSDAQLDEHINREMLRGANEIVEDQLMIDLLNAAGVLRYTGDAVSTATLAGGTSLATADVVKYEDLVKLSIELDNNRCPKNTKIITGSRMVDTKVVNAARYMYIGSELIPSIMRMTDFHGEKAFIPVAQYGSAGTVARGEIGAIDNFRFIVVPEMANWSAAGATVADPDGGDLFRFSHNGTNFRYDVFPMLVVGSESFTNIGFQTDGKTVKFTTYVKKPGRETADRSDPFGETGFSSIKWWYGFMPLRPERIALVKTIAEW
jgi:N4-gp56 family major capsid protein